MSPTVQEEIYNRLWRAFGKFGPYLSLEKEGELDYLVTDLSRRLAKLDAEKDLPVIVCDYLENLNG